MKQPVFVFPDYCHQQAMDSFVKDLRAHDQGRLQGIGWYESCHGDFQKWIQKEKKCHMGIDMDAGVVPATTYLYMLDDDIVGCVNVRHCLNENLIHIGGHIGYSIAPKYRRQGYATQMLKETLQFCQQWEIWPVLVTCNKNNIASKKTIEKCGGIFEDEYSLDGEVTLRYWIGEDKNERF